MAFFLGSGVGSQESAKSFVARAPSPAAFDFARETTAGHPHGWPVVLGSVVGSQKSAKSFVARAPSPATFDFARETTAVHPHGWPVFFRISQESVGKSQRSPLWRGRPHPRPLTLLAKRPPAIRQRLRLCRCPTLARLDEAINSSRIWVAGKCGEVLRVLGGFGCCLLPAPGSCSRMFPWPYAVGPR